MRSYEDLLAFKKGFKLAINIFHLTRDFPKEEQYRLTDQICRSSRSVCANIGEAYRKRNYEKYFINKVADADMENTETQIWLRFARSCKYIDADEFEGLYSLSTEVGKLLDYMMKNPNKFRRNSDK